jgi:hypothetical protein
MSSHTNPAPACENGSLNESESEGRQLVWLEPQRVEGCSECAWIFNPSDPPVGSTLNEMKWNFRMQLAADFQSHVCQDHSRTSSAKKSA